MAYKNSGAMKFNDATDLVIRADPSGTVESCFNLANNTEYVNDPYEYYENQTVKINNASSANRYIDYAEMQSDHDIYVTRYSPITPGDSTTLNIIKNLRITLPSSCKWTLVSGDADISGVYATIRGDAELTIEDA